MFSAKDCPETIFFITTPGPCNKIFRREFIINEGIEFQNIRSCEDKAFVLTALACAKRITLLNEVLFSYRQHSASLQHTQDKYPLAFYESLVELRSRLTARGLYEPLKNAFAAMAAANCCSNLSKMKTSSGYLQVYNCIRDHAIPEFGLNDLPDQTDPNVSSRIYDIPRCSPAEYIALHGPGLRDLIQWKDPVLTAQVIRERIKLLFKKDQA